MPYFDKWTDRHRHEREALMLRATLLRMGCYSASLNSRSLHKKNDVVAMKFPISVCYHTPYE